MKYTLLLDPFTSIHFAIIDTIGDSLKVEEDSSIAPGTATITDMFPNTDQVMVIPSYGQPA